MAQQQAQAAGLEEGVGGRGGGGGGETTQQVAAISTSSLSSSHWKEGTRWCETEDDDDGGEGRRFDGVAEAIGLS
jgi:hypothetical protein